MKVKLVQATENAGKMIADIASICYGKEEAKNPERLLKNLYKLGHHSVFEHVYYTFKIEGISRVTHLQLTRHRHTSPTVESQRYTDQSENIVIMPETIASNPRAYMIFEKTVTQSQEAYKKLRELGIPKEDARYLLPEGIATSKYLSMNLRELIHIAKLRISKQAQWEIRELVREMVRLVVEHSPELEFMFEGVLDNEN